MEIALSGGSWKSWTSAEFQPGGWAFIRYRFQPYQDYYAQSYCQWGIYNAHSRVLTIAHIVSCTRFHQPLVGHFDEPTTP